MRGVRSATVVCPDGELADALATSIFVLGVERGPAGLVRRVYRFFTADPDLSEFTSEKIGLGFSWRADPARGNPRWLRSFETRIANYTRDYAVPLSTEETDFEATTISIALGFRF